VLSRDFKSRLVRRAAKANVFLPDALADGLISYYELLTRWNRKINLTSIENEDAAIDRLLLEPLVAARYLPTESARVIDIGSGGGSPAIPLKLSAARIHITMVEAKARKSAFLREAVRHLELQRARVETSRYEELLARPELHEASDVVTMRAVRVEARVLTTLQAFLSVGGVVMLFRGPGQDDLSGVPVPPLEWTGTYPLVEGIQSRLTILTKHAIGRGRVPRGTSQPGDGEPQGGREPQSGREKGKGKRERKREIG
jgi:16S rRNA (guanine527-N7)-methyltransferase